MAISRKRQAFINEYLKDFNATQAAIRAGYSEKTAHAIGYENLRIPEVKEQIDNRFDEMSMSADEAIKRMSDIARADIGDFMDIESMSFDISLKKAKELGLTHLIKKVKQNTKITLAKSEDGEDVENHYVEIELHDPKDALKEILKIRGGYAPSKHELTGAEGKELVDNDGYNRSISSLADAVREIISRQSEE